MARPKMTPQEVLALVEAHNGNCFGAAKSIGIDHSSLRKRYLRIRAKVSKGEPLVGKNYPLAAEMREVEIAAPPSAIRPIDELLATRKGQFQRKARAEEAGKLIDVKINRDGPIGILHFGDPHVDDDGTDISQLEADSRLVLKTDGLYCANVGDTTNNWVGRLSHLWSQQSTSAAEAWAIAEWWLNLISPKLLYCIAGNHDLWSGDGDPQKWILRQSGALYQSSEARVRLVLPSKHRPRINARHDFAGHSQYNPAHGPSKAVLFGVRDHIAISGHRHKSGYAVLKDPDTDIAMHCIQVASYKIYDRYARDKGFRDQHLSPCAVTVFNTHLPEDHPDFITVWWSAEAGADYLSYLRRRKAA